MRIEQFSSRNRLPNGLREIRWLDGAGSWFQPVSIPAPKPIGSYIPLQQLVEDLGIAVTPLPERHSVQLRHPNGTTIELSRADRGLSTTYKNVLLRMIIQDGHFLVHHYGFEKIGWLGSTTLSPLPDGDWITRRELAASYGLEVSLEGDGIQLRHPDGTSIRFSGVAQGYEAVCQDKTLRMIIQDSGTMVDRTGLREIGWLDETRPAPQPGPTSEPESVPDGDWISVRQWAESAGLGINLSGDGDTAASSWLPHDQLYQSGPGLRSSAPRHHPENKYPRWQHDD